MSKQEMHSFCSLIRKFGSIVLAYFTMLITCGFSAYAQQPPANNSLPAGAQQQSSQSDQMGMNDEEEEVAHPFFTHMGVPEAVGVFNLRLAVLATRADGRTRAISPFTSRPG